MSEVVREMDDSERNANARASVLKKGMDELPQAPFESMMRGTRVAPIDAALEAYFVTFVCS